MMSAGHAIVLSWGYPMAKDYPKCGLVNPPSSELCDCGYNFISLQQTSNVQPESARLDPPLKVLAFVFPFLLNFLGLLLFVLGLVVAGAFYSHYRRKNPKAWEEANWRAEMRRSTAIGAIEGQL